ncbi:hypothetical protein OFN25_33520, partial [Escherichia coli]|nr:hypothetical protein [Escherichia coli]
QLGKQLPLTTPQPLQGVSPLPEGGQLQKFVSTQGEIALYQRFLPSQPLGADSDLATIQSALQQWQHSHIEGVLLPLS